MELGRWINATSNLPTGASACKAGEATVPARRQAGEATGEATATWISYRSERDQPPEPVDKNHGVEQRVPDERTDDRVSQHRHHLVIASAGQRVR